ncbi:MATE family efflux transporter [Halonatronum saccharophilum]|uniref:MATE family efflux transporter n=1 Tax=Halonatronum saccharophilum TaxID=150060 RepID=UPI0004851353|nr:MATE family efflux transporter [Halonatronum saccharophilum]
MEMNKRTKNLGEEAILPLLIKLSLPAIVGMAIQALYNVIDSIYIGRLSTEGLAALSLSFPIQMVLIALAVGTGIGASSLISRSLGANDTKKANNVAVHVMIITLLYALIIGVIGFFFSEELFSFFSNDPKLIELGVPYIRIIMTGSLALFFPMIANSILQGEGNTIAPMLTLLVGAILNIIIDPLLIFGLGPFPALGIKGAAYATVLARIISGLFIGYIIFSDKNQIKVSLKNFKLDWEVIVEIYQVGLPAIVMQLLASIMIAGVNIIVEVYDPIAVAVVGIYFRLQSFVFMPVYGLKQGFLPLFGYNYGHNKPKRMKEAIQWTIFVAFLFTTAGFLLFQFFPSRLILLFNKDERLLEIGITALKRISLAFPLIGPAIVGSSIFQGLGKGLPSLIISFLRQIVLLLPIMYLLGRFYGLAPLWFAFPISELISVIIMSFLLAKEFRRIF